MTDCTATTKQLTFTVSAKDWDSLDRLTGRVLERLCLIMSERLIFPPPLPFSSSNSLITSTKDGSIVGPNTKQLIPIHDSLPRYRVTAAVC